MNYVVEVEGGVIGFHRGMAHHHRVRVPIRAHLEVIWVEQHVIPQVVMGLEPRVRVLGIVRLEEDSLEQHVIHKVVMELEPLAPIHVIQEVHCLAQRVLSHKVPPIHILVPLEDPYQVQHVHSLHLELHNMVVHMVEHNQTMYVSYQQDNVYLPDV